MAPWQLPNTLIYLQAALKPRLLRPDLLVPSVSHVDWAALRRRGYNAVVIDKDNCLTWPEKDELHPSIQRGWSSMKSAFGPGRVLVVSNSAGTRKDTAGVAAESVSRHLGVPVLLHSRKKPGCAVQIVDYLEGRLAVSGPARVEAASADLSELSAAPSDMQTPLLGGHAVPRLQDEEVHPGPLADRQLERPNADAVPPRLEREPLRILVVGDRLATDVLLARRLARSLPVPPKSAIPAVLSVVTTTLFEARDVRPLRWLESRWLRLARQRPGSLARDDHREDWGRYVLDRALDAGPATAIGEPAAVASRGGFLGIYERARSRVRGLFTVATLRRAGAGGVQIGRTAIKGLGQALAAAILRGWRRIRRVQPADSRVA